MTRRPLPGRRDLDAHLEWLRRAIQAPDVNTRVVLDGILDVLEALAVKGDK